MKLVETFRKKQKPNHFMSDNWWWLFFGVIALVIALVLLKPDPFRRILVYIADGIWVSLGVTVASFFITLALGLIAALGRISKVKIVYGIATIYVEIVRGIPLLVQLLFWYFAFPALIQSIGRLLNLDFLKNYLANPIAMAVLGLAFCYGAYMSEVYRAGIKSIPKGQMEAARSLGMTSSQAMWQIILPQAVKVILPPVGNEFISLLKDSSLVSVVAVADVTRRGREFMATTMISIETWITVALVYLIMTLLSTRIVSWIERKTQTER